MLLKTSVGNDHIVTIVKACIVSNLVATRLLGFQILTFNLSGGHQIIRYLNIDPSMIQWPPDCYQNEDLFC